MRLLIVRHAIAEEREAFAGTGMPDSFRPLTAKGRKRMRRGARGLRGLVPRLDLIATSPLTRATETAEIVAAEYDGPEPVSLGDLAPEGVPDSLVPWLCEHDPDAVVALVGHQPHLGFLVAWLLTGRHQAFVELKKGSAVLLEFDDPPAAGNATLLWALAPRHLRKLGKSR